MADSRADNTTMRKAKDLPKETVHLLPQTWAGIMPLMFGVLESGTQKGKEETRKDLTRLAQVCDALIAERKELADKMAGWQGSTKYTDKSQEIDETIETLRSSEVDTEGA